jgi:HK97 family phage prohead protease
MPEHEVRSLINKFEIREIGEGDEKQTHIQGYALTFDTISEDLGFRETIRKGALDNTDMNDVILNINHDNNYILARNNKSDGIGSLKLTIDEKGLFFDTIPTDTSYARDLIKNMESGIIGKCSFRFSLDWTDDDAQSWDWDDGTRGYDFRTVNKIETIMDVSIVTFPAYNSTSTTLYKRSKEEREKDLQTIKELEELKVDLELFKISNEIF